MNIFKKYRIDKNLSIESVCNELKYSRRVIEALEKGETNFIETPFNYYCALNYAKFLNFTIPEEQAQKFK